MLLTRAPLYSVRRPFAFDLHVLGPPLTFALSQDQTLQLKLLSILSGHLKDVSLGDHFAVTLSDTVLITLPTFADLGPAQICE